MRFAEITQAEVDTLRPWAQLVDFGPPRGHEHDTGHLSVMVEADESYARRHTFMIEFDDADLAALAVTKRALVGTCGSVFQPVYCAGVVQPSQARTVDASDLERTEREAVDPLAALEAGRPRP